MDFIVLNMEEDPKIPIILGRSFLNTACAFVDVCESTLTLWVGDESEVFKATQDIKQEETSKEEVSSIDLDDELLEKEFALLQEENPNNVLLSSGGNDDVEKDLEEIEKLLEETDPEETMEFGEYAPTRRVASTDSTSPVEKFRNEDNLDLLFTSSFDVLNMKIFPDPLEGPTAEGEIVKNYCDFPNAQVAYLDTMIQKDEEIRLDEEASMGEKESARADDLTNSSLESQIANQEILSPTIKRTKPRARISTLYEVFTFEPPESLVREESEEESLNSRDDEVEI